MSRSRSVKRRLVSVRQSFPISLTIVALLVPLAACGGGDGDPGDADAPSRQFLSLGSAPAGGAFFGGRQRRSRRW